MVPMQRSSPPVRPGCASQLSHARAPGSGPNAGACGRGLVDARARAPAEEAFLINKELLDILACPLCKTEIRLDEDRIVCDACGRRYPIRDGIPIMLVDEAELPEGAEGTSEEPASGGTS